jgi:hypothetical protein
MSSDHNPIAITLRSHVIWKKPSIKLYNRDTNWTQFQDHINDNINLNLQLQANQYFEDAVDYITTNTNSCMDIYAKRGKYITGRSQPSTAHQGINLRKTQSKTQMAKWQKSTRQNKTKQANLQSTISYNTSQN